MPAVQKSQDRAEGFAGTIGVMSAQKRALEKWPTLFAVLVGLNASISALIWLLSTSAPQPTFARLGFISAIYCGLAVTVFCWAAVAAVVVWRLALSPIVFKLAGIPWAVVGVVLLYQHFPDITHSSTLSVAVMSWPSALYTQNIARWLAYPSMSDAQIWERIAAKSVPRNKHAPDASRA